MSRMKSFWIAAALPALFLSGAALTPAAGQGTGSSLRNHNSNAPVDFAADRIEVQDRADRAIFSGNVVARQAELTLTSDRITVAYSSEGGMAIDRIDASGGVTLRSPGETARGEYAIYDLNERLITMIGNVTLISGRSNVNGGRLVIDLDTGRAVMDGSATGAPPGVSGRGGRVTGTFTVPQRND